jgi:hypothetical protein
LFRQSSWWWMMSFLPLLNWCPNYTPKTKMKMGSCTCPILERMPLVDYE